jgi:Biogenesis of lysosome-related organelles complex 1 subunit 3
VYFFVNHLQIYCHFILQVKTKKRPVSQNILPLMNSTGRIVAGEAPESDDEIEEVASISSAASVSSLASLSGSFSQQSLDEKNLNVKSREEVKYKSLLHKKLSKCTPYLLCEFLM